MEALRQKLTQILPVTDDMWEDVLSCAQIRKVPKGSFILRHGEICQESYFISKGLIRMYYLRNGEEHIRQFFFENGLISDLVSAFTRTPSRLNFDALEDCELIVMPIDLLHRYPQFKEVAMLDGLYHVSNRMASIFMDTPEEKYRELVAGRPKVIQRIPQYMIASYIGVTPEGLSRIKKRIARVDSDR